MNSLRKLPKLAIVSLSLSEITSPKFTLNQPIASLFENFKWPKTSSITLLFLLLNHRMIVARYDSRFNILRDGQMAYEVSRTSEPMHCASQTEIVTALRTIPGAKIAMQLLVNISILRGRIGGRVQQCKGKPIY